MFDEITPSKKKRADIKKEANRSKTKLLCAYYRNGWKKIPAMMNRIGIK